MRHIGKHFKNENPLNKLRNSDVMKQTKIIKQIFRVVNIYYFDFNKLKFFIKAR